MSSKKMDCDIVCDLFPLYHDGIVSENTGKYIKRHLENCADCKKEYEELCIELPIESSEVKTKEKFNNMLKKSKRKSFVTSLIVVSLIIIVVISGYFAQLQIPAVNISSEDITVHRAYKYKTEEGYKMFVLFSYSYNGPTVGDISVEKRTDGDALVMNMKKPLLFINTVETFPREEIWRYELGYESGVGSEKEYSDFNIIECAGNVIWSVNENAEQNIPDYVYAYEEFEEENGDVVSWITNIEQGYLEAGYADGSCIVWDLDGNVLYGE